MIIVQFIVNKSAIILQYVPFKCMEDNISMIIIKISRIDGQLELVANFHSNSVVGRNVGTFKITF